MVDEIYVKGIASFSDLRAQAIRSIIVCLELEVGFVTEFVPPSSEDVSARHVLSLVDIDRGRRRVESNALPLPNRTLI